MIREARDRAGEAAAEALLAQRQRFQQLTVAAPAGPCWREAADLDRDERGDLLIHRENLPAVMVWLQCHDQWKLAGMEGEPIALDMGVALAFAQQLAAEVTDEPISILDTTAGVRIIAADVLEHHRRRRPKPTQPRRR
jgi:hypothetical protein